MVGGRSAEWGPAAGPWGLRPTGDGPGPCRVYVSQIVHLRRQQNAVSLWSPVFQQSVDIRLKNFSDCILNPLVSHFSDVLYEVQTQN